MKKILLAIIILASFTACKKETKTEKDSEIAVQDSAKTPETTENVAIYKPVELTAEKTTNLLNTKNDTLYITNFFATWCGPCMREIPHFKEKMEELKGKPVRFTFISLDEKTNWDTDVKNFVEEKGLQKNVLLLDGATLSPEFFKANFKTWDGSSIPFTFMRKGDKTDETVGMMTKEDLNAKIGKMLNITEKTVKLDDDYTVGTINQPVKM